MHAPAQGDRHAVHILNIKSSQVKSSQVKSSQVKSSGRQRASLRRAAARHLLPCRRERGRGDEPRRLRYRLQDGRDAPRAICAHRGRRDARVHARHLREQIQGADWQAHERQGGGGTRKGTRSSSRSRANRASWSSGASSAVSRTWRRSQTRRSALYCSTEGLSGRCG